MRRDSISMFQSMVKVDAALHQVCVCVGYSMLALVVGVGTWLWIDAWYWNPSVRVMVRIPDDVLDQGEQAVEAWLKNLQGATFPVPHPYQRARGPATCAWTPAGERWCDGNAKELNLNTTLPSVPLD